MENTHCYFLTSCPGDTTVINENLHNKDNNQSLVEILFHAHLPKTKGKKFWQELA